jgi:hypothetical protein
MMYVKAGMALTDVLVDARAFVSYCFALFDCEKHAYFHYLRDYFGYKLLSMILNSLLLYQFSFIIPTNALH